MVAAVTNPVVLVPPAKVRAAGEVWRVRRAWPAGRHGVPVELEPEQGESALGDSRDPQPGGAVRAGWWRPSGVEVLPAGRDRRLPALASVGGTVVSHRPGKRAVARTGGGHHVKVVRTGRAGAILDGITRAAALAETFRMPAVADADSSTVTFATLAGRSLHEAGGPGSTLSADHWQQAWQEVLDAHTAAGSTVPQADDSGVSVIVHDATAEVAVLRRWASHWAGAGAADWARDLEWAVQRVATDLLTGRARPLRVIHRDLHDKQLFWAPGEGPGLLDVDTACWGEAALDLGNLRAHARWRQLQGAWSAERAAVVMETIDRATNDSGIAARTRPYEQAALLRIACVHGFRPADQPLLGHLVAEVVRELA